MTTVDQSGYGLLATSPVPPIVSQEAFGDPLLDVFASYLQASLNARMTAAWQSVQSGASGAVVAAIAGDPTYTAYDKTHLPGLFLWREEWSEPKQIAQDWRVRDSVVKINWVFPLVTNEQRSRIITNFANAVVSVIDQVLIQTRDPSWVVPGDTDPNAETLGSSLPAHTKLVQMFPSTAKRIVIAKRVDENAGPGFYHAVEFQIRVRERMNADTDASAKPTKLAAILQLPADDDNPDPLVMNELEVGDAVGPSDTFFRFYFGALVPATYDTAFIATLSNALSASTSLAFDSNSTAGHYVYFAQPEALGAPTLSVNGWDGGFQKVASNVNDANSVPCGIYRSDFSGLGSVRVRSRVES